MNAFLKTAALAILAGAAMLSPGSPSQAQTQRTTPSGIFDPRAVPPECCAPAMKTVATDATWAVQPTTGGPHAAVPVYGTPIAWHAAIPGSQWIGPDVNAGSLMEPIGNYVYTYHFCLCSAPPTVNTFPATFYLSLLGDNHYTVSLNTHTQTSWTNNPSSQYLTYTTPFSVNSIGVPVSWFQAGDNVLQITVTNDGGPTGLDASGWISGYFRQLAPGERCNRGPIPD